MDLYHQHMHAHQLNNIIDYHRERDEFDDDEAISFFLFLIAPMNEPCIAFDDPYVSDDEPFDNPDSSDAVDGRFDDDDGGRVEVVGRYG